jgi:DNA-binding IclR family transcriptional regulator
MTPANGGAPAARTAPAVRRAAALLGEVAHEGGALTVSTLARRVTMPKSSVSDICAALAHEGLLRRDADGAFQLGAHLCELARAFVGGSSVLDAFATEAARTPQLAQHTVAIVALQQSDAVLLDVRLGRRPLPLTPRPGVRAAAASSATGRLLLATLPAREARALLGDEATDALLAELSRLRERRGGAVAEAAGAVIEIASLVAAPLPVAVVLQVPATDAERHGTEHLTAAMEQLASTLSAPL